MKKILFTLLLMIAFKVYCRQNEGVHFFQATTWKDVLQKAKQEHKYIFVDCYATWCAPCKQMDMAVYTRNDVGKVYNKDFICIRIQLDQTPADDRQIKNWYSIAKSFQANYSIHSLPTFLFFDSTGVPVHKVSGAQSPDQFIRLAKDAFIPEKQYYQILRNFEPGKLDTSEEKGLARSFLYSDKVLAARIAFDYLKRIPEVKLVQKDNELLVTQTQDDQQIRMLAARIIRKEGEANCLDFINSLVRQSEFRDMARSYIRSLDASNIGLYKNLKFIAGLKKDTAVLPIARKYINQLKEDELYVPDNIRFVRTFTDTSSGKAFDLFYKHGRKVDSAMQTEGYSKEVVDAIVGKQIVAALVNKAIKSNLPPDFDQMRQIIVRKFGVGYADDAVLGARITWYKHIRDWPNYTKCLVERTDQDPILKNTPTDIFHLHFGLNAPAWEIFQYSNNQTELRDALRWITIALDKVEPKTDPTCAAFMDTKANLLYKLGKTQDALVLEAQAVKLAPDNLDLQNNISKMKLGVATWK